MSLITLPAAFRPSICQVEMLVNQRVNASPFGGSEQAVDLLNDRLRLTCELPDGKPADGAWREAFIGQMRGQTNTVALWHFRRPEPRGTARGTQTLSASVAQGASSLPITGISPATGTYLAGDMIGCNGLLFMVEANTTAVAGAANVPVTSRVRTALGSGASVAWSRPTASFRLLDTSGVRYVPGRVLATTFDFAEAI